jgi:Chaperone of endosialidase
VSSDLRLKRDVALVGRLDNGLGLYRYRYLWSDTVYVGVMAQEVALLRPDAIVRSRSDSYLRVDYARLGLKLMTLSDWDAVREGKRL